jgi:hypothetical protein
MNAASAPTLDAARALQLLREIVAERPDYVYDPPGVGRCVYTYAGKPSCIVAHVLTRAGWPVQRLITLDRRRPKLASVLAHLLPRYLPGVSEEAAQILRAAQKNQDQDHPWRQALAAAEAAARRVSREATA